MEQGKTEEPKTKATIGLDKDGLSSFLKAAGFDQVFGLFLTKSKQCFFVNMTSDQFSEAGMMYHMKKYIDFHIVNQFSADANRTPEQQDTMVKQIGELHAHIATLEARLATLVQVEKPPTP